MKGVDDIGANCSGMGDMSVDSSTMGENKEPCESNEEVMMDGQCSEVKMETGINENSSTQVTTSDVKDCEETSSLNMKESLSDEVTQGEDETEEKEDEILRPVEDEK